MFEKGYFHGKGSFYKHGYKSLEVISRWRPFIREITRFKKRGKILDIGCAYGFLLKYLPNTFKKYGIDTSGYAIKKAIKSVHNVKFLVHNIEQQTKFKDSSFDVITAFEVLEHLHKPSVALKEIYRILKDDGICVFSFPNTSSILSNIIFKLDTTHKNKSNKLLDEILNYFEILDKKFVLYLGDSHVFILPKITYSLGAGFLIFAKKSE